MPINHLSWRTFYRVPMFVVFVLLLLQLGGCPTAVAPEEDASCGDGPACEEGLECLGGECVLALGTPSNGTTSNATSNGTSATSNGTTSTSNGTTSTSNGTTSTSNGTTSTSNGTTSTSNGTTSTSNGTTSTSNGTTSTSNGTTSTSNGTTSTSNGTTSTSNGTTGGALAYLGATCGMSDTCKATSPDWPDCAFEPCGGGSGRCWALGTSVGYCTHACDSNEDCQGSDGGLWGSDFTCVISEGGGLCMPGTNTSCGIDEDCSGGEVCKIGAVPEDGRLGFGLVCQPPTQGGAAIGGTCNYDPEEGPVALCSHDICYGRACSAPCSGAGDNRCGGSPLTCWDDWGFFDFYGTSEDTITGSFCGPGDCNGGNDCGSGFSCLPRIEGEGNAQVISGLCVPNAYSFGINDLAELGEACNTDDEDEIPNVNCRDGFCAGTGYCSAQCTNNTECGSGQLCIADTLALSETRVVAWKTCVNVPGSQTSCERDNDCSGSEVCNLYYQGTVRTDGGLDGARTDGRCTQPPAGGIATGAVCSETAPCSHDGMCFTVQNNPNDFCSAPCNSNIDCPLSMVCGEGAIWDNNTPNLDTDDLVISICIPDNL